MTANTFNAAVDWVIAIRGDRTVRHTLTTVLYNPAEGVNKSYPPGMIEFQLDPSGYDEWKASVTGRARGEEAGEPKDLGVFWGYNPDTGRYEVSLNALRADVPEIADVETLTVQAEFVQRGALERYWDLWVYRLTATSSGNPVSSVRLVIETPKLSQWQGIFLRVLNLIGHAAPDRLALVSGHRAMSGLELDQRLGKLVYEGAAVVPMGAIAFFDPSFRRDVILAVASFVVGVVASVVGGLILR